MQFSLCLVISKIMSLNLSLVKCVGYKQVWIEVVYVIIVIFGMKNADKMLDDHLEPIYGDWGCLLDGQN